MPTGAQLFISASEAVQGSTTEKTFCSRMRRAISCVYCAPKSRITMDSLSNDWLTLDGVSTDEFLKSYHRCKAPVTSSQLCLYGQVRKIAEDGFVAVDCGLGPRGLSSDRRLRNRQRRH